MDRSAAGALAALPDLPGSTEVMHSLKAAQMTNQKKPNNLKTALIMASIALLFFVGVIARRMWF